MLRANSKSKTGFCFYFFGTERASALARSSFINKGKINSDNESERYISASVRENLSYLRHAKLVQIHSTRISPKEKFNCLIKAISFISTSRAFQMRKMISETSDVNSIHNSYSVL